MNGPPQKPTSARSGSSSSRTSRTASRIGAAHSSGAATRSRSTAAAESLRLLDDRPDALDELHVDAHAEDRGHDVGEEDGRVDAVPAHGLQRHLRAELRRPGDLEEAVPSPAARGTREASGPPAA